MTHLFYFVAIIYVITELRWIYSPIEKTAENKRLDYLGKINKGRRWDDYTKEYKDEIKSKVVFIPLLRII